jgi:cytoskeleton protein RodZ
MTERGSVGIGARLRAARERRGLTVLQAAEKLHVDAKVLEALDAENFEPLGADVYVRGHLRRYAELVGESPGELQDLYASSGLAVRPDLTRIARAERPSESSRLMLPALLAVVGLALAGLLWWMLTLPRTKPQVLTAPAAAAAVGAAVTDAPAPQVPPPTAVAAPGPAAAPSAAVASATPALDLKLSGASWVQVADAHGRVLLDGLLPAGAARSVTGAPPLRVVLGNAAVVQLGVNGRAVSLQGLVRRRGDARLLVDAAGQVTASQARAGTGN